MKKTLIKNIVSIVIALTIIGTGIYAVIKGEISFKDFSGTAIEQSEKIDNNLNEIISEEKVMTGTIYK